MQPQIPDFPSFQLYLAEIAHSPSRFQWSADLAAAAGHDGGGRPVLVIPGFLAHDRMTMRLRNTLIAAHYRAEGWEDGINLGADAAMLDRLGRRLEAIGGGESVAVIGWSLGGLYARELGRRHPELVDRVITLGSPFSGDPRANRAWRLYEFINRHPVDDPPVAHDRRTKPPVPTFALWSPLDGIVAPSSARGMFGEVDRSIEVGCRHLGFVTERRALRAILKALAAEI